MAQVPSACVTVPQHLWKKMWMCVFPGRSRILCFAVFSNLLPLMSVPCGPLDVPGQGSEELLPGIMMSFSLSDENCNWRTWPEFVRNSYVFPKPEVTTNFFPLLRKGYQMDEFCCVPPSAELWFQWKPEILRSSECNQESLEWLPSPVGCSPLEQEWFRAVWLSHAYSLKWRCKNQGHVLSCAEHARFSRVDLGGRTS